MYRIWPTRDNQRIYKFNSYWFELRQEKRITERQTYNMLEWVGDVGGLFDGLVLICRLFVAPLATLTLKLELLKEIFKSRKDSADSPVNN